MTRKRKDVVAQRRKTGKASQAHRTMRTGSWWKAVPGATKDAVVVVVVFGGGFEEDEDEDEEGEKGMVRSCAEMAFAILLKTG